MAFGRSSVLVLALVLSVQLTAGLAAYGGRDVAVYWGRNKYEGTLREACDTGRYTTVIISFLAAFGQGTYRLDLTGHPAPDVADIGNDIKHCQSKKGVLVLLAIGGQGGEYWLPSSQAAADLADYLWNAFLAGSRTDVRRPFGDAQVDGVDFYIDQGAREHYNEVARRLYFYNRYHYRGKGLTLTASPRCGFPDHRLEEALDTGLFNRIHLRLYGEDRQCQATPVQSWEKWAAAYPRSKVFVGVAASPDAAPDGYIPPQDLYNRVIKYGVKWPNYGGLAVWNRFYDKQTDFTARL